MARVELTRRAHADLGRLRRWLADKNPEAAERAARAIIDGLMGLGVIPLMGARAASGGGRELAIDFGREVTLHATESMVTGSSSPAFFMRANSGE
jgi:plasmid stabilization system protein ParE